MILGIGAYQQNRGWWCSHRIRRTRRQHNFPPLVQP